jgi:hypothetical protein
VEQVGQRRLLVRALARLAAGQRRVIVLAAGADVEAAAGRLAPG